MSSRTETGLGVPDILSISRMVGSVFLLLTTPLSPLFLTIYGYCCMSDLLDGFIARRSGTENLRGQVLDSTADIILTVCLLASLIPHLDWDGWMISLIAMIAVIRIISLAIGYIRFGQLALLHTYGNKFSAALRYIAPFVLTMADLDIVMIVVGSITMVAAIEDLAINMRSGELNRNVRSILCVCRHV